RPDSKRNWNRRESSASSSDRATRQLRISPGGSTSKSRRRRPELPPSSLTVTTAEISTEESSEGGRPCAGTYCFSPCSSAESPVPPPIATTCSGPDGNPFGAFRELRVSAISVDDCAHRGGKRFCERRYPAARLRRSCPGKATGESVADSKTRRSRRPAAPRSGCEAPVQWHVSSPRMPRQYRPPDLYIMPERTKHVRLAARDSRRPPG